MMVMIKDLKGGGREREHSGCGIGESEGLQLLCSSNWTVNRGDGEEQGDR